MYIYDRTLGEFTFENIDLSAVEDKKEASVIYTEGEFSYVVEEDEVIIVSYFGSDEEVLIPQKITGHNVAGIRKNAFAHSAVKRASVPENVKVEAGAFNDSVEIVYREVIIVTPTEAVVTPTESVVKPTESIITPSENVTKPTENVVSPTEGEVTPTEGANAPTYGPDTPSENLATPTDNLTKPTEGVVKPSESVVKPTESVAKPTESIITPSENVTKPTDNLVTPTTDSDLPGDKAESVFTPTMGLDGITQKPVVSVTPKGFDNTGSSINFTKVGLVVTGVFLIAVVVIAIFMKHKSK